VSVLLPLWLGGATIAAGAVLALHLLTRATPRPRPLPTARFVPEASRRTLARTARPADVPVMLLRLLAVALIGLTLARPVLSAARRPLAVIALADRSPGADSTALRDALAALAADTILPVQSLSSGLVAARRAGAALARAADAVELVIVSSFTEGIWDDATREVRQVWPGPVTLVRVTPARYVPASVNLEGRADGAAAALRLLGRRGEPAAPGSIVLRWPPDDAAPRDTVFAVHAGGAALVAPLPRFAIEDGGLAIAHFADGAVAAVERPLAGGCERVLGFTLDAGDAAIRGAGLRIVERLIAPCGAGWTADRYRALDSARLALLAGSGPRAAREQLEDRTPGPVSRLGLGLAALALVAERLARRRRA
jgi:hypothetical protein